MKNKKYIVVHAGKRDDYQVALALYEADMLYILVTEAYFPLDNKWFSYFINFFGIQSQINKRFKNGLPSKRVSVSYIAFFYHVLFSLTKNIKFDVKKGEILGKKAKKLSLKYNIPVIAVNTCAADAFENNPIEPKVLFQFHPQANFVKEIFLEEIKLNPKASTTLLQEYEFSLSKEQLNKLNNEIQLATHYLCASSLTKKSLEYTGVLESKINVVPYGVDTSKFTFKKRKKESNFKVIFIGSLNQRKGVTYLLDAMNQLQNVELIIVTRGIYDESLIKNYNFPIDVRVDIPHEKLQEALHEANCFVLPSILEGFGQVILEAMATGIPVIASENTAAVDIIENGKEGFVTSIRDVQAIKDCINRLQNNFSLAELIGEKAYEKSKLYTWQKFRTDLITSLKKIN